MVLVVAVHLVGLAARAGQVGHRFQLEPRSKLACISHAALGVLHLAGKDLRLAENLGRLARGSRCGRAGGRLKRVALTDGLVGIDAAGAQALLHASDKLLHDLDVGVAAELRRHQAPLVLGRIATKPALINLLVLVVVLDLTNVGLVDLPGARLVAHELHESARLHLAGDMQEELHDDEAVVGELALKSAGRPDVLAHTLVGPGRHLHARGAVLARVSLQAYVFHPGARQFVVVGLVEDGHGASLAQAHPIARHEGQAPLVAHGLFHRMHAVSAGIEVNHEVGDAASLARSAPALKEDDRAHVCLDGMLLEKRQTRLQLLASSPILVAAHLGGKHHVLEYAHTLYSSLRSRRSIASLRASMSF